MFMHISISTPTSSPEIVLSSACGQHDFTFVCEPSPPKLFVQMNANSMSAWKTHGPPE